MPAVRRVAVLRALALGDWLFALVQFLGLQSCGDELEFPLTDEDFCRLGQITDAPSTTERYAIIHPGASVEQRRWPVENFAAVADALAERGLQMVLTGVA